MASKNPSPTLYIQNIDQKLKKPDLRRSLYLLFSTYGKVLDVVATRAPNMRGQAFVVFKDLNSSAAAIRALNGEKFFGRDLRISYAATTSHATVLNTSGPEALYALKTKANTIGTSKLTVSDAQKRNLETARRKRAREEDGKDDEDDDMDGRKRRREDDDGDEEMEMEEDSDDEGDEGKKAQPPQKTVVVPATPATSDQPYQVLFIENLPREVTDDILAVLFQQYPGFQTVRMVPSVAPTNDNKNNGLAFVQFDNPNQAEVAKDALDGFMLAPEVRMKVGWAKR